MSTDKPMPFRSLAEALGELARGKKPRAGRWWQMQNVPTSGRSKLPDPQVEDDYPTGMADDDVIRGTVETS